MVSLPDHVEVEAELAPVVLREDVQEELVEVSSSEAKSQDIADIF